MYIRNDIDVGVKYRNKSTCHMIKRKGSPKNVKDDPIDCDEMKLNYICEIRMNESLELLTIKISPSSSGLTERETKKTISNIIATEMVTPQKSQMELQSTTISGYNSESIITKMSIEKFTTINGQAIVALATIGTGTSDEKCNFFNKNGQYTEGLDWFCGKFFYNTCL